MAKMPKYAVSQHKTIAAGGKPGAPKAAPGTKKNLKGGGKVKK